MGFPSKVALGLLIYLGAFGCGRGQQQDQARALAILQANADAMYSLNSFQADCFTKTTYDRGFTGDGRTVYDVARLLAEKPNKMRYDDWHLHKEFVPTKQVPLPHVKAELTFACDGKLHYRQYGNHFRLSKSDPDYLATTLEPWEGFWTRARSVFNDTEAPNVFVTEPTVSLIGTDIVDRTLCDKVRVQYLFNYQGTLIHDDKLYYVGHLDHLIRRLVFHVPNDGTAGYTSDARIVNIELNKQISPKVYVYKPPPGVRDEKYGIPLDPAQLPNGTKAPDFGVRDVSGKFQRLSDFKGTVTLIDFWANWCGPCKMSMPHTESVAKKLLSQGLPVTVLAVDDGEDFAHFAAWVKKNGSIYPNMRFVYSNPDKGVSGKLYKAYAIPTQYVLDKRGVIRASFVGYGGVSVDLENALLGAAKSRN